MFSPTKNLRHFIYVCTAAFCVLWLFNKRIDAAYLPGNMQSMLLFFSGMIFCVTAVNMCRILRLLLSKTRTPAKLTETSQKTLISVMFLMPIIEFQHYCYYPTQRYTFAYSCLILMSLIGIFNLYVQNRLKKVKEPLNH